MRFFAATLALVAASGASGWTYGVSFLDESNTLSWVHDLSDRGKAKRWSWSFSSRLERTMALSGVSGRRDERLASSAELMRDVGSKTTAALMLGFADQGLPGKRIQTGRAVAKLQWQTWPWLEITPRIGGEAERRHFDVRLRTTAGPLAGVSLNASRRTGGLETSFQADAEAREYSETPTRTASANASMSGSPWRSWRIDSAVNGEWSRSDYYGDGITEGQIHSHILTALGSRTAVERKLAWDIRGVLEAVYELRREDYSTQVDTAAARLDRQDRRLQSASFSWSFERAFEDVLSLSLGYHFTRGEERYGSPSRDVDTRRGLISMQVQSRWSRSDSVAVRAELSSTSYDPPDPRSTVRRDVGFANMSGSWSHSFSPRLEAAATLGYRRTHQVYLDEITAGNSSVNETYVLIPVVEWTVVRGVLFRAGFPLSANYITYDLDDRETSNRNALFRRGSVEAGLSSDVSRDLRADLEYRHKREDYGSLVWRDGWTVRILWDRYTDRGGARVTYVPHRDWRLVCGYWYEESWQWTHVPGDEPDVDRRILTETLVRKTSEVGVTYSPQAAVSLSADVSRQVQTRTGAARRVSDRFAVNGTVAF